MQSRRCQRTSCSATVRSGSSHGKDSPASAHMLQMRRPCACSTCSRSACTLRVTSPHAVHAARVSACSSEQSCLPSLHVYGRAMDASAWTSGHHQADNATQTMQCCVCCDTVRLTELCHALAVGAHWTGTILQSEGCQHSPGGPHLSRFQTKTPGAHLGSPQCVSRSCGARCFTLPFSWEAITGSAERHGMSDTIACSAWHRGHLLL
jgi:hypothetical protein